MAYSKIIKLVGLFMREPADLIFLPVSVVFGYFHGFIKLYAMLTLRMVSHSAPYLSSISNPSRHRGEAVQTVMPMTAIA
jgi:hypothetical protein